MGTIDEDGKFVENSYNGTNFYKPKEEDHTRWTRLKFTLFSMFVSSSFFASYSVMAFYTVFLYGLAPKLRAMFLFSSWKAILYEITDATQFMRLFEACYMFRHEQDLYHEEETYRMIQEIIRNPGLYKLMTGGNLKGSLDPALDNLNKEQVRKLQRMWVLE